MPTRRRGRPLSSWFDPKNNLPKAGYYRQDPNDPETNTDVLAIFYDEQDGSIFTIPHKDVVNKDEIFTASITSLRAVASGVYLATSLSPQKAEELIAMYGEDTKGIWVDSKRMNSWFYTYHLEEYIYDRSIESLDEILYKLNKEVK